MTDKLTILILVAAAGFAYCGLWLRRVERATRYCLQKLIDIEATADKIEDYAGQASRTLDDIQQHIENRFPTPEEHDPFL